MKQTLVALTAALTVVFLPALAVAQDDYPRTLSGKPDFSGHYDISTLTPFQRPSKYGNRLVLDQQEVQALRDREVNIRTRGSEPSNPNRSAPEQSA